MRSYCTRELNYEHAITRYVQALGLIAEISAADEEKFKAQLDEIWLSCNLNLALCYINVKKPKLAIENCSSVIRKYPDNAKAFFRRAQAKLDIGEDEESKADLEAALRIVPSDAAIKKWLKKVELIIKKRQDKEKKMYQKMFN